MSESYSDPTVKAPSPYERKIAARLAGAGDHTQIPLRLDPLTRRMEGTAVHGNTPFSVPFISQIRGNLWQGGCADGLILPDFIEHVISLYPWEQYTVRHELKSVLTVRMYDSLDQSAEQVMSIGRWALAASADGPTLIHCQAGLNRSSLVMAAALVQDGLSGPEAIALIREMRSPACLCNPAFETVVKEWT